MKRLKACFRKLEVHLCLFLLTLVLFNWPLLSIAHAKGPFAFYCYLFFAWLFIILLLFLIAISLGSAIPSESDQGNGDDV